MHFSKSVNVFYDHTLQLLDDLNEFKSSFSNREIRKQVAQKLEEYRRLLIDAGFATEDVSTRLALRFRPSMAECILAEQDLLKHATLVVGRKGLSHKEEFLFGSISGKIVRTARN